MEARRRFWRRRRLVLSAPVFLFGVLVLAAECKPHWYRPVTLDEPGLDRARRDAANTADWISGQVVAGLPFDLELSPSVLNDWLFALRHDRPELADRLNVGFRDPVVSFRENEVLLAGVVERNGWRAVATLAFSVAVSTDGQWIDVVVRRAYLGSLAIPVAWIHRLANEPLMALIRDRYADMAGERGNMIKNLEPLLEHDRVTGLRVKNHWIWPNGRRPVRAAGVTLHDGGIRMLIEPSS